MRSDFLSYILFKAMPALRFRAWLLKRLCIKAFKGLLKIIESIKNIYSSETLAPCGF